MCVCHGECPGRGQESMMSQRREGLGEPIPGSVRRIPFLCAGFPIERVLSPYKNTKNGALKMTVRKSSTTDEGKQKM